MPHLPDLFSISPQEGLVKPANTDLAVVANTAAKKFSLLITGPDSEGEEGEIALTPQEARRVASYQQANVILGAAGRAAMVCAPECPFRFRCPLFAINKAPFGSICPFEADYVATRFAAWMLELERTPETLVESERVAISQLVYLDLQESRCLNLLSMAENAEMRSRSVRDIDLETGEAVAWEDVIHPNRQLLTSIIQERRAILRDFELTPEMKTRRKKVEGKTGGNDLASRQSENLAKMREAQKRRAQAQTTIDVPVNHIQ